ncbi:MAG: type II toxin-antitoxin system VapC family toxin [Deltaproteobacteria bacterium]|nr:type II toxin-antitoxin system VapC family toxin [Deltaproteobacteria bacterium]
MSRLLLDTHVWLWSITTPRKLGRKGLRLLENTGNELFLSAASSWEIAIKYKLGRLPLPEPPHQFIPPRLIRDGIKPLSVEHHHACHVANLPDLHRDPFDRLLLAQAQIEKMTFITADQKLKDYKVEMILIES